MMSNLLRTLYVEGYAKYCLIEFSASWEAQQYYRSHHTVEGIEIPKTLHCLPKRIPLGRIELRFDPRCFALCFINHWWATAMGFLRGPESSRT